LLSCQQILEMVRKRDTCSLTSLTHFPAIFKQYSPSTIELLAPKSKKKFNNTRDTRVDVQRKSKRKTGKKNNKGRIGVREYAEAQWKIAYPLSSSHSYIVFSEKSSSMNGTGTVLTKLSKSIGSKGKD